MYIPLNIFSSFTKIVEASKIIMQYVAAVSGKGKQVDKVKEQLLQCNPILEGTQTIIVLAVSISLQ